MMLRPSKVLECLRRGEVASCTKINMADPRVIDIAGLFDIDCVWLDLEHVGNTLGVIENQIRAAKACGIDALVRVARGSYSNLIQPLEMDAAGIMVPHVMNVEDAKQIVRQTRFHPIGRRPLDGGNADGAYCQAPLQAYLKHANEQRMLVLQIEDPEPLDDLDAIASLEGVDMLFFGPGDFSHAIGHAGQFDHPDVVAARRRVAQACQHHGKFAGTTATTDNLKEMIELGYRFLSIGADVISLATTFQSIAEAFKHCDGQRSSQTTVHQYYRQD